MTEQTAPSVQQFLDRQDEDESVTRWKESLLGSAAKENDPRAYPPDDDRRVIVTEFKVIIEGGPTHVYNLTTPEGLAQAAQGYILHEGDRFHYELTVLVHHDIVLGLRMRNKSKKMLNSNEEIFDIGSYPPTVEPIVKVMDECEVPSSFMARGKYKATAFIEDEMKREHFKFDYSFEIQKR